jgi:hypothetical protein
LGLGTKGQTSLQTLFVNKKEKTKKEFKSTPNLLTQGQEVKFHEIKIGR